MSDTDDGLREREAGDLATQPESRRISTVFSPTCFVLALIVIFVFQFIGRSFFPFIPTPGIGAVVFVALGFGWLDSEPRYLEIGTAGAIIQIIHILGSNSYTAIFNFSSRLEIAISSAATAAIVAFVFHFIGRH